MSAAAISRLAKELQSLSKSNENVAARPIDEKNLFEWSATINGPTDTPYESGVFHLKMKFPKQYPFKPPKITFETPIYHCNIDEEGEICLDLLDEKWSPALTIEKILLSISSLMAEPNPDDPLRGDIACEYMTKREEYNQHAKEYTLCFAVTPK